MIQLLKRYQINEEKYNDCVVNSLQSRIYACSWYLDIVADNWDVLVLNDYEAVMPLPIRKKYGITYVYPPFWLLELGMFSVTKEASIKDFNNFLFKKYNFVELKLNTENIIKNSIRVFYEKELQYLELSNNYQSIFNQYKKDKKKAIRRAIENHQLKENWKGSPSELISLFKKNIASRVSKLTENDYCILSNLLKECLKRNKGELLTIYDNSGKAVGAGFFLKHKERVTILVSATDMKYKTKGVNSFLIDRAIYKYHQKFKTFHFGGSSIKSIASFFKSFGAETENYFFVKKRLL